MVVDCLDLDRSMKDVHDVVEDVDSSCSEGDLLKVKPLDPRFSVGEFSGFPGISKQTVHEGLNFLIEEAANCEYLCELFIIRSLPLENALLGDIMFSSAHFEPEGNLQHRILLFVHEPIDEARLVGGSRGLHQAFYQLLLKLRGVFLVNLVNEWEVCDILAYVFPRQPLDEHSVLNEVVFGVLVASLDNGLAVMLNPFDRH